MNSNIVKSLLLASLFSTALGSESLSAISQEEFINTLEPLFANPAEIKTIANATNLDKLTDNHLGIVTSLITPDMAGWVDSYVLSCLLQVPAERLEALKSLTPSFMTAKMSVTERSDIIIALSKVPTESLNRQFQSIAASLITPDMGGWTRSNIIEILAKVPSSSRERFRDFALSAMLPNMNGFDRYRIIKSLSKMPTESLSHQFQSIVTSLITPEMDKQVLFDVIEALAKVPSEKWEEFQTVYMSLIPKMDVMEHWADCAIVSTKFKIIKSLAKVPPQKWEEFQSRAEFLEGDTRGWFHADIIQALGYIPSEKWEEFQSLVMSFMIPEMKGWSRFEIAETLATVPSKQWGEFQSYAMSFMTPEMNGADRAKIIKFLADIPTEKRTPQLQCFALSMITSDMNGDSRIKVINALEKIPTEKWEEFKSFAMSFVTPETTGEERSYVIEGLADIPTEKRTSQLQSYATSFITPRIEGWESPRIVKALAEVPAEKRTPQLQSTFISLTPEMNGEDCAKIIKLLADTPTENLTPQLQSSVDSLIRLTKMESCFKKRVTEAFTKVPSKRWEEFQSCAISMMTSDMSQEDRSIIIAAFAKVPPEKWTSLRTIASSLARDMNGQNRSTIIHNLSYVPTEKWEEFKSISLSLKADMKGWGSDNHEVVITALALASPEKWRQFYAIAKLLITSNMDEQNHYKVSKDILYLARKVPSENWNSQFQALALSLITPKMDGHERAEVIKAFNKVPSGKWKELQSYALSLITPNMNGQERAKVIKAFNKVPSGKWKELHSFAMSMMTSDMFEWSRSFITELLAEIPSEKWKEFQSFATSLIAPDMDGRERYFTIKALTKVPVTIADRVYSQIQTLTRGTGLKFKESQHVDSLVETLSEFNDAQRAQAFINGVIRLCEGDANRSIMVDGNRLLTHMQTMKTRMNAMNNDEVKALIEYRQSTHKKEVHESIAVSLEKLKKRYTEAPKLIENVFYLIAKQIESLPKDSQNNFEEAVNAVKAKYSSTKIPGILESLLKINPYARSGQSNEDTLLNQSTRQALKTYKANEELCKDVTNIVFRYARLKDHEHALAALKFMEQNSLYRDGTSTLSYVEMLSLIYSGINDPHGSINGQILSDKDREGRCLTFRSRLAKARNEYGDNSASCTSGYFNAAVEALDGTHPDVHIIHSFRALMQEIALEPNDKIYEDRLKIALSHLGSEAEKDSYYQDEIKVWQDAREYSKEENTEDEPTHKLGMTPARNNVDD